MNLGGLERLEFAPTGASGSGRQIAAGPGEAFAKAFRGRMHPGNRVTVLLDGAETYAAMFAAIDQARDHINIESYIIEAEGPGEELARRLTARCKAGVKVNLLFDGFGSFSTASSYFDELRSAGVDLCEYNPLRWGLLLNRALHLRDHRKLMVVDGRIGFIGGVNISRVYSSSGSAGILPGPGAGERAVGWRDTHVRVEGPVVAELQRLFLRQWWRFARHPIRHGRYFPPLKVVGGHSAAIAASDAGRWRRHFYRTLLEAMDQARQRILLTSAYFVPTRRLLRTLIRASKRGVEVHLVLPGISDFWAPLQAGRSHYTRLLRAGIRI
ncbi:MAG: phospholipase D-like domain-containing protein, partial [Betaproteobacteria bacterium]